MLLSERKKKKCLKRIFKNKRMENGSNAADTGLLEPVPLDSEIFKGRILPALQDGHMYSESERSFHYTSVFLVNSSALQEQYSNFRAEREESGYTHEELEESFAFLLLDDKNKVNNLCETGLAVRHSACFTLGDPSKGVYISKYSDCLDLNPWYQRKTGYIVVFKLTKGRVKAVAENYTQNYTQPTPGFDCHMSEQISTVSPTTCSFLAYERTQYYLYELCPGDPQAKRPRHACPFAAVAFTYGETVPTTSVLQEQSITLKKTVAHYQPWSGQLQVGSLIFPVVLRSSAGAVLPTQLPATLNIEHLIRLSDLKKLLPQAVFETCFCSEVCFEGWYCSRHAVFSLTAEERLSQLAQELKDRDLALILRLNDSGFLVFIYSSFFLTYEDTMSRQEDVLQGLFVFQNSRVVQKDMKNWRSKLLLPSEILKALPGLTYAEAEVEKCPSDQQEAPCYLVERHLQNYAALIQPGMRDSPSQEASIYPDQYDVPDVSKHLRSAPGTTEASRLRLLSYLNQPEDYSLPITRVMELLEVGKDDEVIDLDDDTYYCISSPDDAPATAKGSCNNVNLEEGLRENQDSICMPGAELGSVVVGGGKTLREEPQTLVRKETEGMFDGPELASLDCSVQISGTLASSSSQELPLAEDTTKRVAPLLIIRQTAKRKSRRRKRRKGNLNIASQEAPVGESFVEKTESATIQPNTLKRKTYQYGLRTIITDCGRVFIPHGSQDITSSTVSMTDVERVMDVISKETGAGTDSPLVPKERAELSPRECVDNQAVLIEAAEQHVSPLVSGQAPATEGAARLAPSLRKVDGRPTLRKTKHRGQIVSEETRDKEVQPSEKVDRGPTVDMEAPSMAVTVEKGDTEAVGMEVASRQTLCMARGDGQVLQPNVDTVTPFISESIANKGVQSNAPPHTNITDKKQPELFISTAHQKGKRKHPLCLISPLLTVLGDTKEPAILSNAGPRPKRGKSCLSENEAENLNINCGNTVAPTLANILSDSSLRKALGSDPELGVQVERAEGNSKVRNWLRRGIPRKSDIADSDGTQCIQKSPSPVTMTEIEKLVKPLKKQLRNRITKYMKENGWFNFDTTASYGSDKLTQPQAQGHNSAASGDRGGGGVSGALFLGSRSPEVAASQSPDALTLLADLALSANDDKLLQGLSPVLGAKLAPGGQNCGTGTDDDTVAGSVLHSLLGHPLPKRRPRRTKRNLPIKSPSPKGVIVTGELLLVISKEHSYSLPPSCLLLGVSGVSSQVPPPVPSGQTDSHCGNSPIVVEKSGTSPCQEVIGAQEMQRLPAESSHCNSKGKRRTFRCWRRVVEVDGLLRITRLWKEKYEFCLDSKYTNDPLDKAVTRALHGPWDSRIEENIEQVHLILHMWIGLFYSKSTARFFQTDSDGEILRGPSPDRNLHAAKTGYSRFTQDFHTTEPEPLDLREERKISEEPLSPTTEILDLSQNQLDVLDLSVPKYGREEMSHVASEMESSTSLHKPDKPIDLAITDTANRSMVALFHSKEHRSRVNSILDEEPEEESGNSSDFQNDCGFELQPLSEPPQNDFVYDELCRHTSDMYISGGKVLNMTFEGKQARAFATAVASQLSGKLGGHVVGLGKKRTAYLQPCKFTNISFVPDVIMPQLVVSDSNLLEDTTKKDSIYNCNVSMPVTVHDGKDHTAQESVVRPDRVDLEGGKDTEILESVQVEVYSALLDQTRREAEVPPCDGHNADVVGDLVESNTSNQSIVPDKWSDVDDVRNSGQDFNDAVASQSRSPAPTLDELPCEPKPCSFHSNALSNKSWSSHDETRTSNECTSTGDLGGTEIPNSSPSFPHAVTDILTCIVDASVQNADNKPSPDSTSEPIVSSIDTDMENALLSCNNSGVLCSKSPTQVSQEGKSVSPLHSPSRSHPSSSCRTTDQSIPTSTSQENTCLNSNCNLDENPQYRDGTSESVNFLTVTPDSLHSSSGSAVKRSSQPGHTPDSLMPNLSTSNPHCSEFSNAANSPESCESSLKGRPSTPELYLQPCSSPGRSLNSSAMLQSPSNNTKVSTTNLTQYNYGVCSDNKHNLTEVSEVFFEKDVTCAIDQCSDQSRNSIDDLLGKVQDGSHSGDEDPSKYNVAYDNPEPYDDSINMPIDHSQSRLHSDLTSVETPPQEDFVSCPSKTSENSHSSPEENINISEPPAIRSSSYKEMPEPVNYDSDFYGSLLYKDLHSSMDVKTSKNQECSLEDIPSLSRVSEHTVSMDNMKDPNAKSATAEEMRNIYEQQNEEDENEECNLLERECLNRFPAEESGSEDNSQSAHCISDPYFSMKTNKHNTDCKMKKRFRSVYQKVIADEQTDKEFLDNRQKNIGLISYKTRISERISDSPITCYTANYKPEMDWTNYCKGIETLKRNKHPVKDDHGIPSHTASPIITVFDHKGNRMTYENYPIVKPGPSGRVRMIRNSGSYLHNFQQKWEELHLARPDMTQDTMDLEYLIFSEKMNQVIKSNQKTSRSTRYAWRRQAMSDVDVTYQNSAVGIHVSKELQSTRLPLRRWKMKVDLTDKAWSRKREAVSSMPCEPPLSLRRLSHLDLKGDTHPAVSDITVECASSYHTIMNDICSGRKFLQHTSKPKEDSALPPCGTRERIFEQMQEETFKDMQEKINAAVRLSSKTKFKFYILVTSDDYFFEQTKELLLAEGHDSIEPEEFNLERQIPISPLLIIIRNEDIAEHICTIPRLLELKRSASVLFAGIDRADDVLHLTHQELFGTGGFVVCDTDALSSLTLDNMKRLVQALEELSKKGKWLWFLHYRDNRLLKENARLSTEARDRKQFLESCQEAGLVETVPYHGCDIMSQDQPDYLHCMIRLQAQHITARFAVFITDVPDDNFENYGIFAMDIDTFLQISRRISTLAEFYE